MTTHTRRFIHDCGLCLFVGQFGKVDAYVHPAVDDDAGTGTIVLRDGNEGHEYAATPLRIVLDEQQYPNDHEQIVLYRKVWRVFTTGRKEAPARCCVDDDNERD